MGKTGNARDNYFLNFLGMLGLYGFQVVFSFLCKICMSQNVVRATREVYVTIYVGVYRIGRAYVLRVVSAGIISPGTLPMAITSNNSAIENRASFSRAAGLRGGGIIMWGIRADPPLPETRAA